MESASNEGWAIIDISANSGHVSKSNNGNIIDSEINILMENSITMITVFNELKLKNDSNLENLIYDLIKAYSIRLKQTEVYFY